MIFPVPAGACVMQEPVGGGTFFHRSNPSAGFSSRTGICRSAAGAAAASGPD